MAKRLNCGNELGKVDAKRHGTVGHFCSMCSGASLWRFSVPERPMHEIIPGLYIYAHTRIGVLKW